MNKPSLRPILALVLILVFFARFADAAGAAILPTVSLTAAPRTVSVGTPVSLTGTIGATAPGFTTTMTLEALPGTATTWAQVGRTVVTSDQVAFAFTATPAASTLYRALLAINPSVNATSATVTVGFIPSLRLSAPAKPTALKRLTVKGSITPALPGEPIVITARVGPKTLSLGEAAVSRAGSYSFAFEPTVAGSWTLFAKAGENAMHLDATRTAHMNVLKVKPKVTLACVPPLPQVGHSARLFGAVQPHLPGRYVYLQRRVRQVWLAATKAKLDSSSRYSVAVRPPLGTTGYRAFIPSGPANMPAYSAARPVLTPPVVTPSEIANATSWIKGRQGVVGYAVVNSDGKLYGYNMNQQFLTASVVKAMLLVDYLRTHRTLSSSAKATLSSMIKVSDNNAATTIYQSVGDGGLRAVARLAGMKHFSVSGSWGSAQLTPADQAGFFYVMDSLIPTRHDKFARYLLSHIVSYQSWGIPAVARPAGWRVFFKDGSEPTPRGQLVHQVARLEKPQATIAIAVMTDGDSSMAYGISTIRGVTARLLGLAH